MGTFLALALVVMVSLGAPLFVVIAAAALGFFYLAGVDLSVVIIEIYRLATSPMLIALFLFALAGYVLAESRASTRLVKLSTAVLGRAPGGLAIVAMVSCAFFTALIEDRYRERFSLGLLTTYGSPGLLFRRVCLSSFTGWWPRWTYPGSSSRAFCPVLS